MVVWIKSEVPLLYSNGVPIILLLKQNKKRRTGNFSRHL